MKTVFLGIALITIFLTGYSQIISDTTQRSEVYCDLYTVRTETVFTKKFEYSIYYGRLEYPLLTKGGQIIENQKELQFTSPIDILNCMNKYGWQLFDVYMLPIGYGGIPGSTVVRYILKKKF